MNFSANLRRELERSGMTRAELARRVGLDRSNVSHWLNRGGLPSLYVLLPVAEALGCRVEDLLK